MTDTKRFCLFCEKHTIWKYNHVLAHSRCSECNCAHSLNSDHVDKLKLILVKHKDAELAEKIKIIMDLQDEITALKVKQSHQAAHITDLIKKLRQEKTKVIDIIGDEKHE